MGSTVLGSIYMTSIHTQKKKVFNEAQTGASF